ncbi:hypothetical protein ACLX1H_009067 [Fusarium chlamydosporum]
MSGAEVLGVATGGLQLITSTWKAAQSVIQFCDKYKNPQHTLEPIKEEVKRVLQSHQLVEKNLSKLPKTENDYITGILKRSNGTITQLVTTLRDLDSKGKLRKAIAITKCLPDIKVLLESLEKDRGDVTVHLQILNALGQVDNQSPGIFRTALSVASTTASVAASTISWFWSTSSASISTHSPPTYSKGGSRICYAPLLGGPT